MVYQSLSLYHFLNFQTGKLTSNTVSFLTLKGVQEYLVAAITYFFTSTIHPCAHKRQVLTVTMLTPTTKQMHDDQDD